MRLVVQNAVITGDSEAYRHLMEVMMSRDVEIVLNACEVLTVPEVEQSDTDPEPEF